MPTCTAVVLGCGAIGAATARLLAADETFERVVVADRDVARARHVAGELGTRLHLHQVASSDRFDGL